MKIGKTAQNAFLKAAEEQGVYIEGNILKIIEDEGNNDFSEYLKLSSAKDKDARKKRLEVTKQIQSQNSELKLAQEQNSNLMEELKEALKDAEEAKQTAENDLDILQKKTQFELMGSIVKVSLAIILGVGIITTLLYAIAIFTGKQTELIGTAWSSMFGILLTNSFSIIGTIMGVKYATENKNSGQ